MRTGTLNQMVAMELVGTRGATSPGVGQASALEATFPGAAWALMLRGQESFPRTVYTTELERRVAFPRSDWALELGARQAPSVLKKQPPSC